VIGNLITSSLFISFTHTWNLPLGESMKTRLTVFVNKINLITAFREEEVHWREFGVFSFCVPTIYGFSALYL
jgi:hypothetical protein